ncbi:MAG: cytochrome c oxidase assembly protein, partial [Pseudomonadota bacterium]
MTDQQPTVKSPERRRADARIALSCLAFFGAMVGLAYASVPLYELFCRVTGYGGTTQRADVAPVEVIDREITVRFDANVGQGLGWDFAPEERSVTMKIGELAEMAYVAGNPLSKASTGSATFNVTPQAAGAYFNKME